MKMPIRLSRFSRLIALIMPLALAPGVLKATDCIDWPKTLTWADFKGPVPAKLTKAAKDVKDAHAKVEKAEADVTAANGDVEKKQAERTALIDKRNEALAKVDAEFDPKIKKASEDRAKAAETPADVKAKATAALDNQKLDPKAKAGKLNKIDADFKAAQKKYDDPAVTKAREAKLKGYDKAIGDLDGQKSAKRKSVNEKFDPQIGQFDKDIESLKDKVDKKNQDKKSAEDAEEKAIDVLNGLEHAATSSTPYVGTLEFEACGKAKDLPVKARFCPDESYVLPEDKQAGSPAMLRHEQLHFDIAEKHARLFKAEAKKLIDAFNAAVDNLNKCQPKDLTDELKKATEAFKKSLREASRKAMADFNADQDAYDHDPAKGPPANGTNHGLNEENQNAWGEQVAKDLNPGK